MKVEVDPACGFCSGVKRAIALAEQHLASGENVYCLGELIHNSQERQRLENLGLKFIDHSAIKHLPKNGTLLIRAHGEPPETFVKAKEAGIELMDATCPVVQKLQQKIRHASGQMEEKGGQLLIVGKKNHAEVRGLMGHAGHRAIIIENETDLNQVSPSIPTTIYAQTTVQPDRFSFILEKIKQIVQTGGREVDILVNPSICRQMSGREPQLTAFARTHDLIIFVSDPMSSNGKMLYQTALAANPSAKFVVNAGDIDPAWFKGVRSTGISGATSTPHWLLKQVAERIKELTGQG